VTNNVGSWISFERRLRSAHAGVANPNGTSDHWIIETRPVGWIIFLLAPSILWFLLRTWARHKVRSRVETGCCPECGYDLRASTERCPECGRAIDRVDHNPETVTTAVELPS
jgi:hypothetical protein